MTHHLSFSRQKNRNLQTQLSCYNHLIILSPTCKMDEIPAMVAAGDFGTLGCFGGADAPVFVLSLVVTVAPT